MAADLDAPVRCHGKIRDRFRWAAPLWRSFPKNRNRRISPVPVCLSESRLTQPTPAAQHSRREPLFMPLSGPSLSARKPAGAGS